MGHEFRIYVKLNKDFWDGGFRYPKEGYLVEYPADDNWDKSRLSYYGLDGEVVSHSLCHRDDLVVPEYFEEVDGVKLR